MHIERWTLDRAGELVECYNDQIDAVPHGFRQTAESFSKGVVEELTELYGLRRADVPQPLVMNGPATPARLGNTRRG